MSTHTSPALRPLLLFLLLLTCLPVRADPRAKLLVVTENSSWLSTLDGQGNLAGPNTQQVKDILNRAGLKADFQVLPWARAFSIATHRPNTLIYSIARTPSRESQFVWLGPLAHMQRVFYRLNREPTSAPQSLDEVKSCCKVCVVNHDVQEEFLQTAGFAQNRQYIATNSPLDCPRLLQSGAAQLLIADPEQLRSQLARLKLPNDQFQAAFTLPPGDELYLAANPQSDPQLIQAIIEAMPPQKAH
ncbi:MAG: transporter substrate-binding domain-containing protein [Aquitalea sp.]|nr:transporter substrate-binding domain-containing protein [Aquitalea sp.]